VSAAAQSIRVLESVRADAAAARDRGRLVGAALEELP
jgi:hypothetical protein